MILHQYLTNIKKLSLVLHGFEDDNEAMTSRSPASKGGLPDRRIARRLIQLFVGLFGFGASLAIMLRAGLGLGPWDVLHQGLARLTGFSIGWVVIAISVLVLILWIPLRQRPGFGTVANAIVVGIAVDATLLVLPSPREMTYRIAFLSLGIVTNAAATGLYIGAGLGPGPRDGLMTGLAARGHSIRAARTAIEILVLIGGVLLGGSIGIGTVLYAFAIGPLAHYFIPKLAITPEKTTGPETDRRETNSLVIEKDLEQCSSA